MNHIEFPNLGLDFNINPIALELPFGIKLHWYGIIIGIGMVLAVLIAYREIKKVRDAEFLFDMLLITLPVGIIGARLYYVIFSWDSYKNNLSEIFAVWHGGLAIYGGIIAGFICVVIFAKVRKIPLLWLLDICSCGCILAQSIGRWGNFVNAEAYGGKTDCFWGMVVNDAGYMVHPTFFYESLWNFIGFLILYFVVLRRKKQDGACLSFYFVWYGAGRFFIEALRSDSLYLGTVKISQVVALISCAAGILLFVFIHTVGKKGKMRNAD